MSLEKRRDKATPIDEENQRRQKRGGAKKPFGVERRYVGQLPKSGFLRKFYEQKQDWHAYRKYATEKARDQAIETLQRKPPVCGRQYEYRVQVES